MNIAGVQDQSHSWEFIIFPSQQLTRCNFFC
jgi:hypothetical protein